MLIYPLKRQSRLAFAPFRIYRSLYPCLDHKQIVAYSTWFRLISHNGILTIRSVVSVILMQAHEVKKYLT